MAVYTKPLAVVAALLGTGADHRFNVGGQNSARATDFCQQECARGENEKNYRNMGELRPQRAGETQSSPREMGRTRCTCS